MIYSIIYKPKDTKEGYHGTLMLEIELYQHRIEGDEWLAFQKQFKKDLYASKIETSTYVAGVANFLNDNLGDDKFNVQEFIDDACHIESLNDFIDFRSDCHPKPKKDASKYHDKINEEIKKIIRNFVEKYNLELKID